jgi:hypothetical protein
MGFRDRFNDLAKQAKDAVAEHQEQIHDAVEHVSVAADEKTHGKYTAKIAKVGEKAGAAVDRLGGDGGEPEADEQTAGAPAVESDPESPAGSET